GRPGREEINGLRACGEERVDAGGIEAVAGLVPQIGPCLSLALDNSPGLCQRGTGNPKPAAGARRGAAETRLLLDNQYLQPVMAGGARGREPRRAGADNEGVAFVSVELLRGHGHAPSL